MRDLANRSEGELITDESHLTASRLTDMLRQNGMLARGHVRRVQLDKWKSQQVSYLYKVKVEYSPDIEPDLPTALVLKFTKPHKPSRRSTTLARREHRFYADIARRMTDPPVPLAVDSVFDPDLGMAHLVMEDLSETHLKPDFPLPPTVPHAEAIVECLAEIHGAWWGSDLLGTEIGTRKDHAWIDRRVDALHLSVDRFLESFGDNLPTPTRHALREAMEVHHRLLHFQERGPVTITHGDAHSSNFLIPKDPAIQRTAALDWEFWDIEPGFNDLAAFIALNWFSDMRRERELELVRRYRDALASRGIDIPWDQCWDDYRLAVIKHVLTPVKQQTNGLQVRSWWVNLQRIVTAYLDLDCRELIARL